MEKNFDWPNFYQEVQNGVSNGHNMMYLGFYMSLHGCQGACTAWRDLPSSTKQKTLNFASDNNANIALSIGGPGEFIEGVMKLGQDNLEQFAQQAAQFAWDQGFQAVDIATELSGALTQPSVWALNGSYSNFISTMVKEVKKVGYTTDKISLTSPAPYFSDNFVKCTQSQIDSDSCSNSLSYFALDSRASAADAVGHINMDMLNEDSNYQTYQYIFVNDNGFEDPASLHDWGCQANNDFGWTGGFVGWTWNSNDGYDTINWPGKLTGDCSCLDSQNCA